jgi:hypothetical protein
MAAPEVSPELAARYEAKLSTYHSVLMPVDLSSAASRDEVMAMIPAPREDARRMIDDALQGKRPLGRVVVWDNVDEDGDVVRLDSGGVTVTVTLRNASDTFVFPYDPGSTLSITGVRDGGGGITVAVGLAAGPIPLPPLRVGETRHLPLY